MEELEQPDLGSKENFGKFKDAESLLKAYENLESEFTKKSQRLAHLEEDVEKQNAIASRQQEIDEKIEQFVNKFESVRPFKSALKESLANGQNSIEEEAVKLMSENYKPASAYAEDDEFLNTYIYSNNQIKDKIIKDYLKNITQNSPIKISTSSSSISLTPPSSPATIQEAGRMAKNIIKQK